MLGGIEPQHFTTMFGLDHVRLQEGGQEILAGRGDIGQGVFAAGLGIAGIPRVQKKLQQDLEDYFKPLGAIERINKALLSLGHARTELKSTQLSAEEWLGHEQRWQPREPSMAGYKRSAIAWTANGNGWNASSGRCLPWRNVRLCWQNWRPSQTPGFCPKILPPAERPLSRSISWPRIVATATKRC